ncbi:hypothetical protein [Sorangium sp. So ce381]
MVLLSTLIPVALAEVVNPRWTQGLAGALLTVMGGIYLVGAQRQGAS